MYVKIKVDQSVYYVKKAVIESGQWSKNTAEYISDAIIENNKLVKCRVPIEEILDDYLRI